MRARHRNEPTLHSRHISVTRSNYHKPFLSSSRRLTLAAALEVCTLRTRQPSEADDQIDERRRKWSSYGSRGIYGVYPGTLRLVPRPLDYQSAAVTFTVVAVRRKLAVHLITIGLHT